MSSTKTKKKRKNKKKKASHPIAPFLLPAALVLILLAVILLAGDRTVEPAPTTAATLSPPESNPYLAEDFTYENGFLTCTVANSALGIDVSEHQTSVDWNAVKAAGVEFVMLRAGYRGYTEGELYEDSCFDAYLTGAREAGLDVGVYFFSQAVSVEEAEAEAAFLLDILEGTELEMPVVFDWEYVSGESRNGTVSGRTVTDCAIAFCDAVAKAGYDPMVYFNSDLGINMLRLRELTDYGFWLAQYSDTLDFPYRVQMWQYTHTGTVPGIEGNVDINLWLP